MIRLYRQRGAATLLIILLTGLAVAVASLSGLSALNSTRQRLLTTHAQTAAQGAAWRGVEVVRQLLSQADLTTYAVDCSSNDSSPLFDLMTDNQSALTALNLRQARLTRICKNDSTDYRITALVTGDAGEERDGEPLATATLEVVYLISTSGQISTTTVVSFNYDLELSGSITINKDTDDLTSYELNINGALDACQGNGIAGLDVVRATGSICIGSGSSYGSLLSNGDIKLSGGVSVSDAIARGNICTSGGVNINGTVKANGSVVASNGSLGDVFAIGSSDRTNQVNYCNDSVYTVDLQNNASAQSITADGDVRVGSGSITDSGGLKASGSFTDTNWGGTESGQVGGEVTGSNPDTYDWIKRIPGLTVSISPVQLINFVEVKFDAYSSAIKSQANYLFMIDNNGYKTVSISGINGIQDGIYFIGDYNGGPYKDYLCKSLLPSSSASSPICDPSSSPIASSPGPICKGYSDWNNCITYDSSTKKWTLTGAKLSPGISWFDGDVYLNGSTGLASTIITTGSILPVGGSVSIYSVNYGGYSGACANSDFPGRYVERYCNIDNKEFIVAPGGSVIGNYALMAGSYNSAGVYQGGNISLGSSSHIYGSVLAGANYANDGETTVYGGITALALNSALAPSKWSGSTTINLTNLPDTYTPLVQPCQVSGNCSGESGSGSGSVNNVPQIKWSRYL